ncbi:MAG TPA: carboxypeptidase-like regulatory domain-containing protein, partial [Bacteroidales bacterium]
MRIELSYLKYQQKPLIRMKLLTVVLVLLAVQMTIAANYLNADPNKKIVKAQQTKIEGTVTDANTGEALPGVSIAIEGSASGVITDLNGKYSIEVPSHDATLVFSFVGYLPEKVAVQGKTQIDVKLVSDIKKLDDV